MSEVKERTEVIQEAVIAAIFEVKNRDSDEESFVESVAKMTWSRLLDSQIDSKTTGKVFQGGKYSVTIELEDVSYVSSWCVNGPDVMMETLKEVPRVKTEPPAFTEKNPIETAFATLTSAMVADPGYLWSWVCNTACPIMDAGVEHGLANKAAARLLAHLFHVDVTEMPEYKDIIARASKEATDDGEADIDPAVNTIHVTVTGFDGNSGAEALARHIDFILRSGGQYETKLNIADTTLPDSERSLALPKKADTLVHVTGVESRYHTDRVNALDDSDLLDTEEGVDDAWGIDADCDEACDEGQYEPEGKMTINLKVGGTDLSPLTTIEYFRSAYPKADLNVDINPDDILTDEIARQSSEAAKRTVHITVDENDPEPDATIAFIQEVILASDEPTGMVAIEEKPTLANPENRKNAYVFVKDTGSDNLIAVLHADTRVEGFDPETFVGEGFYPLQMPDHKALENLLAKHVPTAVEYALDLYVNNERWLNEFGDGTVPIKRRIDGPFSLWNISQASIPQAIYSEVEDCWLAFQNIDRLPDLAEKLNDPTIIIGAEDYLKVTRGGMMVVREHPRLEELFLKYIKFKAQFDPVIGRWINSFEF